MVADATVVQKDGEVDPPFRSVYLLAPYAHSLIEYISLTICRKSPREIDWQGLHIFSRSQLFRHENCVKSDADPTNVEGKRERTRAMRQRHRLPKLFLGLHEHLPLVQSEPPGQ